MEKSFEGFTGCVSIEEVVYRYLVFKEEGVKTSVLDWSMYAYINDNLADGLWERLRGGANGCI